jgi:hypothetical protein
LSERREKNRERGRTARGEGQRTKIHKGREEEIKERGGTMQQQDRKERKHLATEIDKHKTDPVSRVLCFVVLSFYSHSPSPPSLPLSLSPTYVFTMVRIANTPSLPHFPDKPTPFRFLSLVQRE